MSLQRLVGKLTYALPAFLLLLSACGKKDSNDGSVTLGAFTEADRISLPVTNTVDFHTAAKGEYNLVKIRTNQIDLVKDSKLAVIQEFSTPGKITGGKSDPTGFRVDWGKNDKSQVTKTTFPINIPFALSADGKRTNVQRPRYFEFKMSSEGEYEVRAKDEDSNVGRPVLGPFATGTRNAANVYTLIATPTMYRATAVQQENRLIVTVTGTRGQNLDAVELTYQK